MIGLNTQGGDATLSTGPAPGALPSKQKQTIGGPSPITSGAPNVAQDAVPELQPEPTPEINQSEALESSFNSFQSRLSRRPLPNAPRTDVFGGVARLKF